VNCLLTLKLGYSTVAGGPEFRSSRDLLVATLTLLLPPFDRLDVGGGPDEIIRGPADSIALDSTDRRPRDEMVIKLSPKGVVGKGIQGILRSTAPEDKRTSISVPVFGDKGKPAVVLSLSR